MTCETPVLTACTKPAADLGDLADHSKMTDFINGCPSGNIRDIYGIGKGNKNTLSKIGLSTDQDVIDLYIAYDCESEPFIKHFVEAGTTESSATDAFGCIDNWYKNVENRLACEEAAAEAAAAQAAAEQAAKEEAERQKEEMENNPQEEEDEEEVEEEEDDLPKEASSKKWSEFVSAPANDKKVTAIYGLGDTTAEALAHHGITRAAQLIAAYADCQDNENVQQCFFDFMESKDAYSGRWTKHVFANIEHYCDKFEDDCAPDSGANDNNNGSGRQCTGDYQRTVIQIKKKTKPNQDLSIKGSVAGDRYKTIEQHIDISMLWI